MQFYLFFKKIKCIPNPTTTHGTGAAPTRRDGLVPAPHPLIILQKVKRGKNVCWLIIIIISQTRETGIISLGWNLKKGVANKSSQTKETGIIFFKMGDWNVLTWTSLGRIRRGRQEYGVQTALRRRWRATAASSGSWNQRPTYCGQYGQRNRIHPQMQTPTIPAAIKQEPTV